MQQINNIFQSIKVWVLAPQIISNEANIDYYYDFTQSIAEYTKTFAELNIQWQWQPITIHNFKSVINKIAASNLPLQPIIFNLCDGDELNGAPGISVIHYLEEKKLIYTGADAFFYDITTSKIPMKLAFDKHQVATALWQPIINKQTTLNSIFKKLGNPIIVKPAISGGSMGVGIKNVVKNKSELNVQVKKMFDGYKGWQLAAGGIVAESFIDGPEYTVLIVGNYQQPNQAIIYTPVERIFHASLPPTEKFLSFDRLWEIYEEENAMPNNENFYEYQPAPLALQDEIKLLAWNAFVACKGTGYTRADIRMNNATKQLFVLEVNAQCGLSEDENFTSIGAILKASGKSFTNLVSEILYNALTKLQ